MVILSVLEPPKNPPRIATGVSDDGETVRFLVEFLEGLIRRYSPFSEQ